MIAALTLPEPTAEQLANKIWNDVIDIMSHGLQTDWRERLDASLSALEPAQARHVRELLGDKVNTKIKQLSDQLERLRAADDYLRAEKSPQISWSVKKFANKALGDDGAPAHRVARARPGRRRAGVDDRRRGGARLAAPATKLDK